MSDSVGVLGDEAVAERLREHGVSVVTGRVGDVPPTDRLVAVGQAAVSAVAAADTDPLVLPVEAGRGVRSVARNEVTAAVAALTDAAVERHPVLSVSAAGSPVGTALFDVTLVAAEAARISEYTVTTPTDAVGQFRADGITVATAAGSPGYARRIGGPILAPTDTVGVAAPIAPFATNPDHWVLPLSGLSLSVERDEATVALFVDGDPEGTVACEESVTLSQTGTLRVAVVPESRSRFG
ncbi:diacylglycerol kinase catalytic domain-containing protein [Haloarcula amylovorans]|uniref:NAD(+)/NADH kinase n=1 Tax=Haloarcula amylovorans TaxID=2562280 RepID=UPI001075E57A|nr:NAD(+)/NADH kinase [Halomicroarcula amylolytica]